MPFHKKIILVYTIYIVNIFAFMRRPCHVSFDKYLLAVGTEVKYQGMIISKIFWL